MLHCLTFFSRGRCSIATTLHPPGWLVQWVLTKAWDDAKATNDPSIQRLKDPTTHRFQAFQRKSFDSWRWCSRWRSKLLDEFESLTVTQGCIVCDLRLFRWFGCLSHVSCLRTDTRMLQLCVWSSSWLSLPTIPSILFWSRPRGLKRSKSSPQLFCFIRFSWSPRSPLSSLSLCFFSFWFFPFLASTLTFRITNSLGPTTMTTWSSWHTSLRAVNYNCAKKVPTTKDPSWSNYVDWRCNHMQPTSALVFEITFPNGTSMTTARCPAEKYARNGVWEASLKMKTQSFQVQRAV